MTDNKNIIDFKSTYILNGQDYLHISQGGVDRKISAETLLSKIEGGSPFNVIPTEENSTSRTITLGDRDKFIQCLNPSGCIVTLPNHSQAPFEVGEQFTIKNDSDGVVSFASAPDVVIRESSIGLSMPTKGQTASFIYVGTNTWNMVSGGGGSTASQRFRVNRNSNISSTGTGSISYIKDLQMVVAGLVGGARYKIDAMVYFYTSTGGTVLYQITPESMIGEFLGSTDFLTHLGDVDGASPTINNDQGLRAPQNTLNQPVSGGMCVRVTGEVTLSPTDNDIALHWSPVGDGEEISLMVGSTLTVERVS